MAAESIATPEMMEKVYGELRRLAEHYLRRQRRDHTLQPTALIHEAYLCLAGWEGAPWRDRAHFVGVAALLMRQVLVMHARKHEAAKRGGGNLQVSLSEAVASGGASILDVLALDAALTKLESQSALACRIVELRFFGGLGIEEIADFLEVSPATVNRSWTFTKTWLRRELEEGSSP